MAKARKSEQSDGRKMIARNRRASFEYELFEIFEAGIVLLGPEVKSLREGRASLGDAYASVRRGEAFLHKLHISPYEPATRDNAEPMRERKLLLHRAQIHKLASKVAERGFTIVPVSLYFKDGRAKVELALARGKQSHDKRQAIKQRDDKREADRAMRRGRDAR